MVTAIIQVGATLTYKHNQLSCLVRVTIPPTTPALAISPTIPETQIQSMIIKAPNLVPLIHHELVLSLQSILIFTYLSFHLTSFHLTSPSSTTSVANLHLNLGLGRTRTIEGA